MFPASGKILVEIGWFADPDTMSKTIGKDVRLFGRRRVAVTGSKYTRSRLDNLGKMKRKLDLCGADDVLWLKAELVTGMRMLLFSANFKAELVNKHTLFLQIHHVFHHMFIVIDTNNAVHCLIKTKKASENIIMITNYTAICVMLNCYCPAGQIMPS